MGPLNDSFRPFLECKKGETIEPAQNVAFSFVREYRDTVCYQMHLF